MRAHATFTAALVLALMASLLVVTPLAAANVQLSGTVKNSSGFGVASVTVDILNGNSTVNSTTTDTSGHYSLSVPSGTYTVRATPVAGSNYLTATAPSQAFTSDTTVDLTLIPVTGTVALHGTVSDALGGGAPNVSLGFNPGSGGGGQSAITDANGHYSLQMTPGTYNLLFGTNPLSNVASPNVPQSYQLAIPSLTITQDTTIDLPLPLKHITIHVQEANGSPAPGTKLQIGTNPYGGIPVGSLTANVNSVSYSNITTDGSGDAPVWLFPTGSNGPGYTITATPPTGSSSVTTTLANVFVTADTTVTLVLAHAVTLSGTVLDGVGSGAPNVSLSLSPATGGGGQSAISDGNGHYAILVAPGVYNLLFGTNPLSNTSSPNVPQQFQMAVPSLTISQDTTLDLPLPLKHVTVHVQDSTSAAVANTKLQIGTNPYGGVAVGSVVVNVNTVSYSNVTTDGSGDAPVWLFPTVSNGPGYTITATPPAGSGSIATTLANVAVTADATITLTLVHPITLSGTVRDGLGNGVPNQNLGLSLPTGGSGQSTTTDGNGHYTIQVAPDTYSLGLTNSLTQGSPNVPQSYDLRVPSLALVQDTTLDLPLPLKHITIHVQDATGSPVANTKLQIGTNPYGGVAVGSVTVNVNLVSYSNITTDGSGDAPVWLFPTGSNSPGYIITATPPAGSNNPVTSLSGLAVTADATVTIVLQVATATGAASGGTSASFSGTGFQSGTQVFFDGLPATAVVITTSAATTANPHSAAASSVSRLIAAPPAHSPGKVDVKIVNPDGLTVTIHGGYEYVAIAAVPGTRPSANGSSPGPGSPVPSARPGTGTGGTAPPDAAPVHR